MPEFKNEVAQGLSIKLALSETCMKSKYVLGHVKSPQWVCAQLNRFMNGHFSKAIPNPHLSKSTSISSRKKSLVLTVCLQAMQRDAKMFQMPRNPASSDLRLAGLQLPLYAVLVLGSITFARLYHPRRTSVYLYWSHLS